MHNNRDTVIWYSQQWIEQPFAARGKERRKWELKIKIIN